MYLPDAHCFLQDMGNTVPANDREAVFYQHEYAERFFQLMCKTEIEKLDEIELIQDYSAPPDYDPSKPNHPKLNDMSTKF